MKKAIIVGASGQDGTIMMTFLKEKKYAILGIDRTKTICVGEEFSSYHNDVIDILDSNEIENLIKSTTPDEIYYLAAYHHSSEDALESNILLFEKSYDINIKGYINFLEAIRKFSPSTRIFYASSSLIFAGTDTKVQDENTLPCPNSIYGITKLDSMFLGKLYRNNYNIFAASGILYNHESEYRSPKFISMKIIQGALDIKHGKSDKLAIGDLSAQVDRGCAYDYVEAMYMMLQHDRPEEFIIASGETHTVQELIEIVFEHLGLSWKEYIVEEKNIIQRKKGLLCGENRKILKDVGRKPKKGFKGMVLGIMGRYLYT